MNARALFVIGRHRSGTTWVSNILASLPEVYAPSHEVHQGVHESALFSHLVPYCNHGRTKSDLLAIQYLFERSDFFRLTGLRAGPDILEHGVVDYFRQVMEQAAAGKRARYWLEKTPAHTLYAGFLRLSFPDAIMLGVRRDHHAVVASNIHGFGRPASPWSWLWQTAVTAVYEKLIERHAEFTVRYEELLSHYDQTVRFMLEQLGFDTAAVPRTAYARNSSYADRAPALTWWQRLMIATGRALVVALPARLVEFIVTTLRARSRGRLPKWFFRLRESTCP
jgi:hypothetical protein